MRRTYSRDFKIKVCELVIKENLSTAIVAEKFGIHRVMLCRWVSEYQEYGSEAFVGTGHQKALQMTGPEKGFLLLTSHLGDPNRKPLTVAQFRQLALQVKKLFPEAVLMFLVPPSMAELKNRLITRGRESETEIAERIANAKWELEQADKYTVLIENDDLGDCVNDVLDYIDSKRKERKKIIGLINETV